MKCQALFSTEKRTISPNLPSDAVQIQGPVVQNVAQGLVVQSVVSLMSSLRVISLTVLVDSIYNILIFFAEKM